MSEAQEALTLRPEEQENEEIPRVMVVVTWHQRQVRMVVDPHGDNWDWAVAEYIRKAKKLIRGMEAQEACDG